MRAVVVRYALVLATVVVLQRAVLAGLRIDGVSADLLLVLAIAAGVAGGVERGAVVGFAAGLALDLLVVTPFGLGSLCGLTAGSIAGFLESGIVHSARWLTAAIAFVSAAAGLLLFALVGTLLGQPNWLDWHLVVVIAIVGLSSAVLVFPLRAACLWADPPMEGYRAAVR